MADVSKLPPQLDSKKCTCRAIIETPKGCRNKFDYDPDSGLFMLAGLLPEGMAFPFDFGFIPSTLGEDGDPLDILVLICAVGAHYETSSSLTSKVRLGTPPRPWRHQSLRIHRFSAGPGLLL